jgi:hypothetical protein
MKKFILSLFALLGMAGATFAQTIAVDNVEALPGKKAKATLNITCPADKYTGMQVKLQFPESFSMAEEKAISGWDGSLEYSMNNGLAKFAAASKSAFSATTIEVEFIVADDAENGEEYGVTVSGWLEGSGVDDAPFTEVTFKVKVVDRLTLDESSDVLPLALGAGTNVKVVRTIKKGQWSTICLPFAMPADKWKAAFGNDAEIRRFSDYEVKDDNIIVKFEAPITTALVANYPHIIKTSKDVDITSFDVDGVNLNPNEETAKKVTQYEDEETGEMADRCYFAGVLKAGTVIPEDGLFLKDGKFYYSTGKTTSKAFRGYFWFKDKISDASRIIMSFDDATGIKNVNVVDNDKVYDLQGRPVENPAKGVYIIGGKKVLVK